MNLRKIILTVCLTVLGAFSFTGTAFASVDLGKSVVFPAEQVVRSAGSEALITVKLVDSAGYGVAGHRVKLIASSDSTVKAHSPSGITNANGESVFIISSSNEGIVYYSAYDSTEDVILKSRAKVVYFGSTVSLFGDVGNSSGPVDHLKIEGVSSDLKVGENATFTVSAYDDADQIVTGYASDIRFSVTDGVESYVSLPADYTFTPDDLGKHTFSLALSFLQPGTYGIEARDLNDLPVYGEMAFTVSTSGSSALPASSVVVSSPVAGTYSNDVQVVSGKVAPGSRLKIYNNDVEIGSLIADIAGSFAFTTPALGSGSHKIQVAIVNEVGTIIETSAPILIKVDVSGPEISKAILLPSETVTPGTVVKVQLHTADQLSKAVLNFRGNLYAMQNSGKGYYETSFAAPLEAGDYDLDFTVNDVLGNEVKLTKFKTVKVGTENGSTVVTGGLIGNVTNLTATAADRRVSLSWDPTPAGAGPVVNYRVFFGLAPNQLSEAVDTFTNASTWYIPNLNNGVTYYFAAVAIDSTGRVSERFSNIVSATPGGGGVIDSTPIDVINGTAGGDALAEMDADVSETGPELLWLVVLALIAGAFYTNFSRRFV